MWRLLEGSVSCEAFLSVLSELPPPVATIVQGGAPPLIPEALLPQLVTDTVAVTYSDQRVWGNSPARSIPEDTWVKVEALLAGGDMVSTNWLEGAKQVQASMQRGRPPVIGCRITLRISPHQ